MRITYVIPTLDQSGAERQLTLLAKGVVEAGHVANVIALNRGGHYANELRCADIPVSVLQKRFRLDPLTWWRLRTMLRDQSPDVIQSFLFSANTYVRLPGVAPGRSRVVVSERCVDSWKSGWQLQLDGRLKLRMDRMTANSTAVADFYESRVGVDRRKIHVIPNGVPSSSPLNQMPDLRAELKLPSSTPIVGFVGRLAPQKQLKDLLWAFHLLHQAIDDVVLVLVGDGPEREELAAFANSVGCRSRVYFMGHRPDAAQLGGQFDVFCLPSAFEGMSNSLMDAMAAGVPVVVSDIPANTELISHEVTGLVCPLGQSAEFCRAAKRLFDEPEFASGLAEAARNLIQERHSVDQMVKEHIRLYEDICS